MLNNNTPDTKKLFDVACESMDEHVSIKWFKLSVPIFKYTQVKYVVIEESAPSFSKHRSYKIQFMAITSTDTTHPSDNGMEFELADDSFIQAPRDYFLVFVKVYAVCSITATFQTILLILILVGKEKHHEQYKNVA